MSAEWTWAAVRRRSSIVSAVHLALARSALVAARTSFSRVWVAELGAPVPELGSAVAVVDSCTSVGVAVGVGADERAGSSTGRFGGGHPSQSDELSATTTTPASSSAASRAPIVIRRVRRCRLTGGMDDGGISVVGWDAQVIGAH